jgi:sucrose-6-phosphate hydrolase SacC (GH32 family)
VLEHIVGGNRDPRVFWHAASKQWVMALYLDKTDFAIFGSPNLKQWKKLCDVSMPGCGECPDFFELPLDGNKADTRWVFTNANESYRIGRFDGTNFTPETDVIKGHYGGNYYAAQTYSDIPAEDGRRIQIGWMNGGTYPQMPFNQQMGFPCELTLRATPDGPRIFRRPVREIENLYHRTHGLREDHLTPAKNPLEGVTGELFDINLVLQPNGAKSVTLSVRGEKIVWTADGEKLTMLGKEAPVKLVNGRLTLRVLVDRTTVEIYAQDGLVFMASCFLPARDRNDLALEADGGMPYIVSLDTRELRSSWVAAQELLPAVTPLFDTPLRDPSVCVVDGEYYMVGTTGAPTWWVTNEGIRLWKSKDLKTWEPQGLVWSFDKDATWQKERGGKRALWAPEIHCLKGTYWLTYCMNYEGTGLLKSVSGKPEGPYKDVKTDGPLTGNIDASLFQDDDGTVYFVWQNGMIAPMKDDMSGLAAEPKLLVPANAPQVGFEGAFIFKADGKYHLCCADYINGDYHCMSATSDSLMGPYGDRYCAVPHGGHNMFFRDVEGNWWSTLFGSDPSAPIHEQAGLVRVTIAPDGRIAPLNTPPEQPQP